MSPDSQPSGVARCELEGDSVGGHVALELRGGLGDGVRISERGVGRGSARLSSSELLKRRRRAAAEVDVSLSSDAYFP